MKYLYRLSASRREHVLAVVLTASSLALSGCGEKKSQEQRAQPPPPEVSVMEVIQRDVPIYVELVGQTRGSQDVEIRARIEGWLEGIHFQEGSEVQKGDLLYSIDPDPLLEQVAAAEGRLASARAQVASANSQVAEASAQVAEAEAQLARAQGDVDKFSPLAKIAAISRRDLDTAVAERDAALQRVRAAEERVEAARGGVKAAEGQVAAAKAQLEAAKIQLGYTKIYAPLSGLIGKTLAYVGDLVGRPPLVDLNTISQLEPIHVEFSISERELLDLMKRIPEDQRKQQRSQDLELILADGSVYPETGSINFADRQVDPATGTLLLQASFPNPDKLLRPGQFARVRGLVETKMGGLLIPQRAVQELQGQYQVFVVGEENVAQVRPVTLGERVESLWLVEKGLESGDRVVVEGIQRVRPGTPVAPRDVPPPDEAGEASGAEPTSDKGQ